MKILLFLPKAFEHMESSVFIDVFGWANDLLEQNIIVETAGFTKQVTSTFNVPIVVDQLIDDICIDDYDALAIPGGFGDWGYLDEAHDEQFLSLIRDFHQKHKIIASVCMGALAVGKSGILKDKTATTYHLNDSPRLDTLQSYDVNVVKERVVVDSNIITSCGPETAVWVAFHLLEMLTSKREAIIVKEAMGYLFTTDKNGYVCQ